jgi:aminoglycoside 2''-phosphotransferase
MEIDDCRQLLAQYFPQVEIHSLALILSGWDALVLDVNDRLIFRFPRRPENEALMEKQMDLLPRLAGRLPIPVPQVQYACRKSAGAAHTLMGYPKIAGVGLDKLPVVPQVIVQQLGEFLSALHCFPLEKAFPGLDVAPSPQDWREQYEDTYRWVQDLALPRLSKPDRLAASLLWEVYLSTEDNFRFQPRLIHGDLGPEHILCAPSEADKASSGITGLQGVIDWEDARPGDPALDFAGLFSLGGEALVDRTLSCYQGAVDETFRRRVRFYYTIAPFYEIRFALSIRDESQLNHAIETLSHSLRV